MTMHDGLVDQATRFKKRIASLDLSDYKVVRRGQLVVSFPIDEGVLDFQTLYDAGIVSPAYGIWDVTDDQRIDSSYLKRYLRSPRAMAYYRTKLRGSTARRRSLPADVFLALPVPVPRRDEQRRVAAILDQADAARKRMLGALSLLMELRQGLFASATHHAADITIHALLQMGALTVHKDGNHGSLYPRAEEFGPSGVPFISAKAITDDNFIDMSCIEYLNEAKAEKLKIGRIQAGDVLLCHNASVGKVAKYNGSVGNAIIGTSLTCFRSDPAIFDSTFLEASLSSRGFQSQLAHNMAQSTRNQVPITAQRSLSLPWIGIDAQREFSTRADHIYAALKRVKKSMAATAELFASLQARAFCGEL
jgi:type I restriction enzyme S subunit